MKRQPRLLDLCCKAGGASMGYAQAGFEVVGVDIEPQPHYPFEFHQADALSYPLKGFDIIHVSPPCQAYSSLGALHGTQEKYVRLIDIFREKLQDSHLPYVIENVIGAKKSMVHPILLCGEMFGLRTYRHRLFESNIELHAPSHPKHIIRAAQPGAIPKNNEYWSIGGHFGQKDKAQREGLEIDWMKTVAEIANAIPPSYTHYIGSQLIYLT